MTSQIRKRLGTINKRKFTFCLILFLTVEGSSLLLSSRSRRIKMYAKICPVCKNTFFSENEHFESDSELHNDCALKKISKTNTEQRSFRTSTPIADYENSSASSFTDSVTDFFYQSWKRGLHSDVERTHINSSEQWNHQPYTILQPVCYTPQFVYINVQCVQQIGYTYDSTFGFVPLYWTWNFS